MTEALIHNALIHNETLGRLIRSGGWAELAEGTPCLIRRAVEAEDNKTISGLAEFFCQEMQVVYNIYDQWFGDTRQCLLDKGMSLQKLDSEHQLIREKLKPYHASALKPRQTVWDDVGAHLKRLVNTELTIKQRLEALDLTVETWRDLHDCEVDQISGLFNLVMENHGELALKDMYENWVIGDWFAKRYQRFDVSKISWETASWLLIYLGFEGHHGHISGSERDGTIDYEEDDEKVTISFAPCGSGGRVMQGEARDGMPALSEAPFNWPELSGAHDFTWNETGICAYCAHCCILHEKLPVASFGYPVRITTPPKAPLTAESRCSWTVYKDLRNIPEEAYTRVGGVKPPADAPLGSAGRAKREAMISEAAKNA
ncbi:MAG: hypothetical protein HRU29_13720 [Rhizobiales bacterium]|nr:hypothetical protein [Hyphomicrobiales bacterium]NRB15452.1 hypothetical protein [Hyphomicrobiales bacterium]